MAGYLVVWYGNSRSVVRLADIACLETVKEWHGLVPYSVYVRKTDRTMITAASGSFDFCERMREQLSELIEWARAQDVVCHWTYVNESEV